MPQRLRLPVRLDARVVSLSLALAGGAGCPGASATGPADTQPAGPDGAVEDAALASDGSNDAAADVTADVALADASGDSTLEGSVEAAAQDDGCVVSSATLCEPFPEDGGTIGLQYLDGAVVGTAVFYSDGGGEVYLLDGGYGGTIVSNSIGMQWVEDAGPCTGFV